MSAVLVLLAVPVAAASLYLLALTLASRRRAPPPAGPLLRFDLIVPAHDEEDGIAATVASLRAVDWPADRFRVVVVADNCKDRTAERAAEAGAEVLVRNEPERRGKGYALALAFERTLAGTADAAAVVDADTVVSKNLLAAFAARLGAGAGAVQADYAVRNRDASWRTRLMTIALSLFHVLRSLGRERLGLSCGLRGNGMCFARRTLVEVPHDAFSLVEDLEYGLRLGEAGHRVHYAGDAHVFGEMVTGGKQSQSQRRRWEGGRAQIARRDGARLLRLAAARRDPVLFELVLDLLVPPLTTLGAGVALGLAASLLAHAEAAADVFGFSAFALVAYVVRGWQLSGTGARGLVDLACAPAYLAWKLALAAGRPAREREWVRTTRERKDR